MGKTTQKSSSQKNITSDASWVAELWNISLQGIDSQEKSNFLVRTDQFSGHIWCSFKEKQGFEENDACLGLCIDDKIKTKENQSKMEETTYAFGGGMHSTCKNHTRECFSLTGAVKHLPKVEKSEKSMEEKKMALSGKIIKKPPASDIGTFFFLPSFFIPSFFLHIPT